MSQDRKLELSLLLSLVKQLYLIDFPKTKYMLRKYLLNYINIKKCLYPYTCCLNSWLA